MTRVYVLIFCLVLAGGALVPLTSHAQTSGSAADGPVDAFEDPAELDDVELDDAGLDDDEFEDLGLDDEDFSDFLPGAETETTISDPLEDINRPIFEMNLALDRYVFRPVTRMYMEIPAPARGGISNALDNLESPVIMFNDLLQGEFARAGATFGRFFLNSVFGVGGLIDVADNMGLPRHEEDFGQTLASYGVGPGPYVVLPFLGPSSARDALGFAFDTAIDPTNVLIPAAASGTATGVGLVDARSRTIDDTETLEETSLDLYAAVRSLYSQNREFEIENRRVSDSVPSRGGGAPSGQSSAAPVQTTLRQNLRLRFGDAGQ